GPSPRRRNPVPPSRPAGRARAGGSVLPASGVAGGQAFSGRRVAMVRGRRIVLGLLIAIASIGAQAQERFITVASTTSTEQSGLFGELLHIFEKQAVIKVRGVALGTGQALDLARRGDADVVFVHAKSAEEKFLAEGHGVKRFPVMYNDFVLIGPKSDPAKVAGGRDILEALKKVKSASAPFVSRGDRSGTHIAELDLWTLAGIDIAKDKGPWYK